ncbi:MAG: hypothetical protein O9345_09970 [Burkholderiaceae bacterium]|jgi:hypothetical protein|nr:hypothetical protein [Burkholderiales bacterium]MCZ8338469.1 hypothetical protein [Burkholderiaceae bacterium]
MTAPRWIPRARNEAPCEAEASAMHAAREADGPIERARDAR